MGHAYYNENDPAAAAWLRELIKEGCIAPGEVDERSITEVAPSDLAGFVQCHFFAGIGGWSYALRLAGWNPSRPVWTGSCPCQPFSTAGKGKGGDDPRHLWPAWFRLLRESKPDVVFGEQVSGAIGHGWLDLLQTDLETEGYAVGHCVLGAHSVGAPHLRQRLYWVANANNGGCGQGGKRGDVDEVPRGAAMERSTAAERSPRGGLGDPDLSGPQGRGLRLDGESDQCPAGPSGPDGGMDEPSGPGGCGGNTPRDESGELGGPSAASDLVRLRGTRREGGKARQQFVPDTYRSSWSPIAWLPCSDRRTRPTQPGLFPLAHGVSGRMGLLRGYGNAIVPQTAAAFIQAYLDVT